MSRSLKKGPYIHYKLEQRVLDNVATEKKKLEIDRQQKTKNAEQLKKQSAQLSAQLKEKQRKRKGRRNAERIGYVS